MYVAAKETVPRYTSAHRVAIAFLVLPLARLHSASNYAAVARDLKHYSARLGISGNGQEVT